MNRLPLIGVSSDRELQGDLPRHSAAEKYLDVLVSLSGGLPVIIPALHTHIDLEAIVERIDGLLVTGGYSNICPSHYGDENIEPDPLRDPHRDHTDLALIRLAHARGVPVFGICRGHQAINVAFGGTLHQQVHLHEGHMDHRENPDDPVDLRYGPAHEVELTPGGFMAGLLNTDRIRVNSLHAQAVNKVGKGLMVEARAPDGVIEAMSMPESETFILSVQWHPEWKARGNFVSEKLFRVFGERCRARRAQKLSGSLPL
jgi:putative glutamine amidotransferase